MKLYKKQKNNCTKDIINEIENIYPVFLNTNTHYETYVIHITKSPYKHMKELNFKLTNFFNKLNKTCEINYLFVLEYPERISRGNPEIVNCNPHGHIVVNTSLSEIDFRESVNYFFKDSDIKIENTTKRNDRHLFWRYQTKQGVKNYLLNNDSYNYKILVN